MVSIGITMASTMKPPVENIDVQAPPTPLVLTDQTNMHERLQKGKEKVGGRVVQESHLLPALAALPCAALAGTRPLKIPECAPPTVTRAPRRFRATFLLRCTNNSL